MQGIWIICYLFTEMPTQQQNAIVHEYQSFAQCSIYEEVINASGL